ncbi:hypothetical protein [Helicobacter sp.]|uniref:hypothetical protein n=1 Tax=Helicobacter sp. TaxID=218 RepID=UPI0025C6D02D|nr:hypothetical protein [Helicobacter sp.]MCI5968251.1 hypothetical protein [Helicobacter sp.]
MILQTKGVLNILKLPLNILKHHAQNATTNTSTDTAQLLQPPPLSNTAYELGKLALRLSQSSKKPKYFILLFRILRAKNRYKS